MKPLKNILYESSIGNMVKMIGLIIMTLSIPLAMIYLAQGGIEVALILMMIFIVAFFMFITGVMYNKILINNNLIMAIYEHLYSEQKGKSSNEKPKVG
jgi:hypothetical protein